MSILRTSQYGEANHATRDLLLRLELQEPQRISRLSRLDAPSAQPDQPDHEHLQSRTPGLQREAADRMQALLESTQ